MKVLGRCCHRSVVALFPLLKNCRSLLCLISLNVFFCFFLNVQMIIVFVE